jgi:hypothetical protein
VKDARQVAWSYIADQNGRYIDADDFEAQVVALTKIIEADRASRGTGERESGRREECPAWCLHSGCEHKCAKGAAGHGGGCDCLQHVPVEPPTGHLEVANLGTEDALTMAAKSRDTNRLARLAAEASLEVAVRALEEIERRGVIERRGGKLICTMCGGEFWRVAVGSVCVGMGCVSADASRALAALRAAALDSAGDAGTGDKP